MAYKFQHGQAILSGALDQEGSIDIKNDGSGEFELKHDGNTILDSSRALGNVTTISGSEIISGRDLKLDVGGKVGISTDTDLLTLTAQKVSVAGVHSASARIDGFGLRIDTGGTIGTAGDTDLLTLNNASVVVAGELQPLTVSASARVDAFGLRVDTGGVIGTAGDNDLLTLNNASLVVAGEIQPLTVSASARVDAFGLRVDTGGTIGTAGDTDLLTLNNASLVVAGEIQPLTVSASARVDAFGLRIDTGGVIGTAGDTDLLTLNNDQLVVAGAAQVSNGLSATGGNIAAAAGAVSGSTGLAGRGVTIDEGGKLGTSADADLVQLDANKVSVAGVVSGSQRLDGRGLRIDTGGVIGTAGDTDLLTLNNGSLVIAGGAQVSTGLSATGGNIGAAGGAVSGSTGLAGRGLTLDTNGVIGTAGDADLLTLANGVLQIAGELSSSGELDALAVNAHSFSINNEDFIDASSNITAAGLSGSGNLLAAGTVRLDGVAAATIAEGADFFYILDADDNLMKKESVADVVSGLAGDGLKNGSNKFALDLNELTAAAVDVANDSIAIVDANDSNLSKKESIADLVSGIAGGGLTATAGVLSTQAGTVTSIRTDGAVNTTALVEGYNYMTGSASKSVTLPASPTVGDVVIVKAGNLADGEALTVARAGSHTIDGLTSVELESDYAAASFVYLVANNWGIV